MFRFTTHSARRSLFAPTALAAAAILVACGGSDDDGAAPDPVPPVPRPAEIVGTVATGAAVPSASIRVTDAAGNDACTAAAVVTDDAGRYACRIADGRSAPFVVVATHDNGMPPMVSVGLKTPTADAAAVVNVSPLTTAIVAQLAGDDALAVVADRSKVDAARLVAITDKVLAQLKPATDAIGVAAGYDPFTTPMVAAAAGQAGDAADRLLDALRFAAVDGQWTVAPVDRPDARIAVADAQTASPAVVAAPSTAAIDAPTALRRLSGALDACFALPVAQRVVARDATIPRHAGGPEVTESAPACEDGIVADDFLNNGYAAGQYFDAALTSAEMVGAKFQAPEILLMQPDAAGPGAHQAIVNLRYRDASGAPGYYILVAQRQTAAVGKLAIGDWLLVGNQQRVDTSVQPVVARREQLAPGAGSGSGPFGAAGASRFESALNLFVNKDGPGSVGLRAARVTGPGLPTAGVVLTPPSPSICTQQHWMNVRRKDGRTDPAAATPAGDVGNRFYLHRTVGITGADATTRRTNPNEAGTNATQFVNWAHPLDYGRDPGSADYVDFASLQPMAQYRVELYYDGETAPRHAYDKRLIAAATPATVAASLPWLSIDAATRRLLDPADAMAAAASRFDLAWTANPLAGTVVSAGVYTSSAGRVVNQGQVAVQRGATSAVAPAPTGDACGADATFPALTADGTASRLIQLRLRTSDASQKDSFVRYN